MFVSSRGSVLVQGTGSQELMEAVRRLGSWYSEVGVGLEEGDRWVLGGQGLKSMAGVELPRPWRAGVVEFGPQGRSDMDGSRNAGF